MNVPGTQRFKKAALQAATRINCDGMRLGERHGGRTQPGEKVKFAFPRNGLSTHQSHVKRFLKVGGIYTVKTLEVDGFSSRVKFEECPDEWFNTVFFTNV